MESLSPAISSNIRQQRMRAALIRSHPAPIRAEDRYVPSIREKAEFMANCVHYSMLTANVPLSPSYVNRCIMTAMNLEATAAASSYTPEQYYSSMRAMQRRAPLGFQTPCQELIDALVDYLQDRPRN